MFLSIHQKNSAKALPTNELAAPTNTLFFSLSRSSTPSNLFHDPNRALPDTKRTDPRRREQSARALYSPSIPLEITPPPHLVSLRICAIRQRTVGKRSLFHLSPMTPETDANSPFPPPAREFPGAASGHHKHGPGRLLVVPVLQVSNPDYRTKWLSARQAQNRPWSVSDAQSCPPDSFRTRLFSQRSSGAPPNSDKGLYWGRI